MASLLSLTERCRCRTNGRMLRACRSLNSPLGLRRLLVLFAPRLRRRRRAAPRAQTHYACPLNRGNVHEDIVSAAGQGDETEALGRVIPLHLAQLYDARL